MRKRDLFPDVYASRMSYGGKGSRQTITGACCTILFYMIVVTVIGAFVWPVHQNEEPSFVSTVMPFDKDQVMKLGRDFALVFTIDGRNGWGQTLDPTKITVFAV